MSLNKTPRISIFLFPVALPMLYFLVSFAQEKFIYDPGEQRDPFMPLVTADGRIMKIDDEDKKTVLSLEGIIYDQYGSSCAIVNGIVVRIGDNVAEYHVLKIEADKIVLIKDGQLNEIELKKEGE